MQQQVYFVGSSAEIAHHAAPLSGQLAYQIIAPEQIAEIAVPGDLAIFYTEHFDRFRAAIGQLRKLGVASLYMIDGILEWRNAWQNRQDEPACPFTMRPVLADKVACLGPAQARVLQCWGNEGKVEIVGVPRFDKLRSLQKRTPTSGPFRLLVMTAKCPSYMTDDRENLHRCLHDIREFAKTQHPKIELVWRLTADWDRHLGVQNSLTELTGDELAQQLTTVDAVISTPSTAALESMLLDLPTAIVDYSNSPSYSRSAWRISAHSHLESQIAELKSPSQAKLHFQRQILADELYLQSNATDRMVQLVHLMLRISRTCIENDSPIAFPDQLLPVPAGLGAVAIGFNHQSLFPDTPEFKRDDLTQLQIELAHSRREIEHLNNQLAQLQSELKQAHQIFDQIHRHPIVGPVVRIRQKLIKLVRRTKRSNAHPKPG